MSTSVASAEIVIFGATAAGVCAAVAAAEAGADVALIEPGNHVGGMTSGGLGYTDVGDVRVLGGLAARFRRDVAAHYGVATGHFAGPEPHVAEAIFLHWLEQAGVAVHFGVRVVSAQMRNTTHGATIDALLDAGGRRWKASRYIDASYEGDVLAMAGVSYRVGRESTSLHGESLAGRREFMPGRHNLPPVISPFEDPSGYQESSLLPGINPRPLAPVGEGDGGVMAYGFRVCLTTSADRLDLTPPPELPENYLELGRRLFHHWERNGITHSANWFLGLEENLPAGKCDANSLGPFSLNVLDGSNWDYPDADFAERERIREHHLNHTRAVLWFLGHDTAVPADVRHEIRRWGLPPDEFADTGHLPHQLYVREARRMLGEVHLIQHDLSRPTAWPDTIAMGSYHFDVREVQRTWAWVPEHPKPWARVFTEGYYSIAVPRYAIPYRAMLPRRHECDNLLVPVCLSASHVAFSSIRMEPQYQMLGHAAGVAAAQSHRLNHALHDIDIDHLQRLLRDA